MKSFKNVMVGALAAAFTFAPFASLTSFASVLPDDVAGTRFSEPVQILSALKIMVGDDDGAFRLNDNIKRSEVAKMAVHALGLEELAESAKGESRFPDVSRDHWANGYINVATTHGLIEGDDNGNFRPNDSITYAEAMAIFVRACGYEVMAEDKGGFPNGHIVVAGSNGMTKHVQGTSNAPITRGNVAFLTNNSLTVKLMERTGYGDDASYEVTDKTLLNDKLKVTKKNGQITAIPSTSLEGESTLNKGQIKIGTEIYETAYNMNNLFAHNVDFYVKENEAGDNEVILAMPKKDQNSSIVVNADLFEGITTKNGKKAIEFFETKNSSKTTIASIEDGAKLIYNGKAGELTDEMLNISGKAGKIQLLDTDRNGIYDVVFVTNYFNVVVEEVTSKNKIIDKYGAPTIDLSNEDISFRILRGLQSIEPKELKEFDVLSVAKSADGELYDITVSNESVTGKVTGKDSEGFYIAGNHYKVAANYKETIKIGTEGIFYLDIEGKIAAIDNKVTTSDNYGYLIRAYASDETETATFRIFTKTGEDKTFTANQKIRFNGTAGQIATEVVDNFISDGKTVRQLVTYTTNSEGKLTGIYSSHDNTQTGSSIEDKFTLDYNMTEAVYNEKLQTLGSIRLTDETVIFDIQDDVDEYSIAKLDMFEDKQKYNVMVYDTTDEFTAKAVVVTNAEFQTNAEASIAVVDKIVSTVNSHDEETDRLYAFIDGEQKELLAENKGLLVKGEGNNALESGDIIQFKTNEKGEIVKIRVLFDIDTKGTEMTQTPVDDLEVIYGKVVKKFTNSINVTVNGGAVRNIVIPSDVKVYSVDTTKTKNNITVATAGDIQAYDEDEGNRVFVRIFDEVVKEIVIIK